MKLKYDWNNVNWADQDIVIAKKLGCSKQRVCQRRKEMSKGQSPNYCKHKIDLHNNLLHMQTEDKTLAELSILSGYGPITVRHILDEHNKGYLFNDRRKGGKYAWGTADWKKTDKEVASQLGVPNKNVVASHRRRMGIIKQRVKVTRFIPKHKKDV